MELSTCFCLLIFFLYHIQLDIRDQHYKIQGHPRCKTDSHVIMQKTHSHETHITDSEIKKERKEKAATTDLHWP